MRSMCSEAHIPILSAMVTERTASVGSKVTIIKCKFKVNRKFMIICSSN